MNILLIINDGPYGSENAYNALRLSLALLKEQEDLQLNIFLMADAVGCASKDQSTPDGYYNIERMLKGLLKRGAAVHLCGTCMKSRGLKQAEMVDGSEVSSMRNLAQWTLQADRVINY